MTSQHSKFNFFKYTYMNYECLCIILCRHMGYERNLFENMLVSLIMVRRFNGLKNEQSSNSNTFRFSHTMLTDKFIIQKFNAAYRMKHSICYFSNKSEHAQHCVQCLKRKKNTKNTFMVHAASSQHQIKSFGNSNHNLHIVNCKYILHSSRWFVIIHYYLCCCGCLLLIAHLVFMAPMTTLVGLALKRVGGWQLEVKAQKKI